MRVTPALLLDAKLRLLRMHYESHVGHIGGNLSCLDILMVLYHDVLGEDDTFILSKGHAAGALYIALWSAGLLTDEDLTTFHKDGTRLSGHPPVRGIPEIPFPTGSLGHGLSLAAGVALGKKLKNEPGRVYCLTSDGEWNEGSTWEALIFLSHHRLDNLTVIVDLNGLQGFGSTRDIADIGPLAAKLRAFGVHTVNVDGHNPVALAEAIAGTGHGPAAIVANTMKGCGVSFMENRFEWHYLPLNDELYAQAVREMNESCAMHYAALS